MIQRRCSGVATTLLVLLAGGCRGEAAGPSEPPKAGKQEASAGADAGPPARETTTARDEPMTTTPTPAPTAAPLGPPLAAGAVAPAFVRWWGPWSKEHLATHPLRATLDERVATGGTAKDHACDELAAHVRERAPLGSPELLFGDSAALLGLGQRCWWLHHDGMMGAGLGAALASDGRVMAVWVVLEG